MTDRELLELAAKAAGIWVGDANFSDPIDRKYTPALGLWVHVGDSEDIGHWWNPLNNGDHTLLLAAKLKIDLEWQHDDNAVEAYIRNDELPSMYCPSYPACDYKRAIVDVAANAGKAMP